MHLGCQASQRILTSWTQYPFVFMLQAANAIAEEPHIPVNKYQLLEQEDALMRRFKKS